MKRKILIVGGVAGGATAIARLRRLSEESELILFEKGNYVSFANCGLPYYIGGVIPERDNLFVADKDLIEERYGVDIRLNSEVLSIDKENRKITVLNKEINETYEESYDDLLLSTGSTPFIPPMKGTENENVFTLWNINDTDKIVDYIDNNEVRKAIVAGGGFIGLEMAENLANRGIKVTVLEYSNQVMAPFDKDISKTIENELVRQGIDLRLNTGLSEIEASGKSVLLSNGEEIDTDMVLLSIGVRPNSKLAVDAELETNERGGVIVNRLLKTSDDHIYAVGDMIEVVNKVNNEKTMIPLAGPANKQGRAVAANILGLKSEIYEGSIGTSVAKIFNLTVAATGENEKSLNRRGLKLHEDYDYVLIHPSSHAGYYPGASQLTIKLIFSIPDGRVLGAQITGEKGVDKRIDTVATTIHFCGTVFDLTKLELAYAPPYSSAKDPINYAGYVATDMLEGLTESISYSEYISEKDLYVLLDIRENPELKANGIIDDEQVHIPLSELRGRIKELNKEKTYLTYCAVGLRGYLAERILRENGLKVKNLKGGYKSYLTEKL